MKEMDKSRLAEVISEKADERDLTISYDKLIYNIETWIDGVENRGRVLDIGCGGGFALCLLCARYEFDYGIGVDPYIPEDGNDEEDYKALINLITDMGFRDRIEIFRSPIKIFFENHFEESNFDLVLMRDVLHHIFPSEKPLYKNFNMSEDCEKLLVNVRKRLHNKGTLLIEEVARTGLRQILLKSKNVSYYNKQNISEWKKVLDAAGFKKIEVRTYVPYCLRLLRKLLDNPFGRKLCCTRYFLICRK